MKTSYLLISVFSLAVASAVLAQPGPGPRGPRAPRHSRGHRPPPIVAVLDTNKDGVISADEIAKAPASLSTLDKNGDGKLSFDELHPGRPADAPAPRDQAAAMRHASPVMLALDSNADGELSADEIANSSTSLMGLDTNHDGELTVDELRPWPPEDGRPPRG